MYLRLLIGKIRALHGITDQRFSGLKEVTLGSSYYILSTDYQVIQKLMTCQSVESKVWVACSATDGMSLLPSCPQGLGTTGGKPEVRLDRSQAMSSGHTRQLPQ